MATQLATAPETPALFTYDRSGDSYRHGQVSVDGRVATVAMNVDPDGGLVPGYKLKLNSYDLGVDIELNDIVQRLRFEQPQVGCVVLTSGQERIFCSGANIYMLGTSSHAWKVNFCKFTNETRNGFENSSQNGSLKFLAAVNGTCASGGYEVALACDEILLVDVRFDWTGGTATLTVSAPSDSPPTDGDACQAQGTNFWPLAMARELDDAILMLRTNEPELGLWLIESEGDGAKVLAYDDAMLAHKDHWFVNEVIGMLRRTLSRLDASSRSMYAVVRPGSAFAGTLAELMLAADQQYMLEMLSAPEDGPQLHLGLANFGLYPMCNGLGRLESRFMGNPERMDELKQLIGSPMPICANI